MNSEFENLAQRAETMSRSLSYCNRDVGTVKFQLLELAQAIRKTAYDAGLTPFPYGHTEANLEIKDGNEVLPR